MKRCMYCGHENEDASETCVKCGNQLMEMPAVFDDLRQDFCNHIIDHRVPLSY